MRRWVRVTAEHRHWRQGSCGSSKLTAWGQHVRCCGGQSQFCSIEYTHKGRRCNKRFSKDLGPRRHPNWTLTPFPVCNDSLNYPCNEVQPKTWPCNGWSALCSLTGNMGCQHSHSPWVCVPLGNLKSWAEPVLQTLWFPCEINNLITLETVTGWPRRPVHGTSLATSYENITRLVFNLDSQPINAP